MSGKHGQVEEEGGYDFTEFFRARGSRRRGYLGAVGISRPDGTERAYGWLGYDRDGRELGRFRDREEAISEVLATAERPRAGRGARHADATAAAAPGGTPRDVNADPERQPDHRTPAAVQSRIDSTDTDRGAGMNHHDATDPREQHDRSRADRAGQQEPRLSAGYADAVEHAVQLRAQQLIEAFRGGDEDRFAGILADLPAGAVAGLDSLLAEHVTAPELGPIADWTRMDLAAYQPSPDAAEAVTDRLRGEPAAQDGTTAVGREHVAAGGQPVTPSPAELARWDAEWDAQWAGWGSQAEADSAVRGDLAFTDHPSYVPSPSGRPPTLDRVDDALQQAETTLDGLDAAAELDQAEHPAQPAADDRTAASDRAEGAGLDLDGP